MQMSRDHQRPGDIKNVRDRPSKGGPQIALEVVLENSQSESVSDRCKEVSFKSNAPNILEQVKEACSKILTFLRGLSQRNQSVGTSTGVNHHAPGCGESGLSLQPPNRNRVVK